MIESMIDDAREDSHDNSHDNNADALTTLSSEHVDEAAASNVAVADAGQVTEAVERDGRQALDDETETEKETQKRSDLDLGYSVNLKSFAGPLDLLLYLVRRSEVDIVDIPIVEIADQFVDTLRSWKDMDLDVAGDFILMATSLLELKARMIVPPEADDLEEDEEALVDPRAELISQLLAYRKFKEASLVLQRLEEHNTLCHYRRLSERIPDAQEDIDDFDLENADPYQLYSVWDSMMSIIEGKSDRIVVYDDVPIEQRAQLIVSTLEKVNEAELSWLFSGVETRIQRIGVFVAILDCVRKTYVEAIQHEQYGSVYLRYRQEEERTAKAVLPEIQEEEGVKKRRRRKRQLVTFQQTEEILTEIALAAAVQTAEKTPEEIEEENKPLVTDEQLFLQELDGKTNVDGLLAISKDLEAAIQAALYEQGILEMHSVDETEDNDESDNEEDEYEDEDDESDDEDDDETNDNDDTEVDGAAQTDSVEVSLQSESAEDSQEESEDDLEEEDEDCDDDDE